MATHQCARCPPESSQKPMDKGIKYEILSENGSVFSCAEHLGKVVSNEVRAYGPVEVKDV